MKAASGMMNRMVEEDQEDLTPPAASPSSSTAMTDGDDDPNTPLTPAAFQWKRFLSMTLVSWIHALSGAVMLHLESIRERIAEESLRQYNRVSGRPPVTELPSSAEGNLREKPSDPAYEDPMFTPRTRGNVMSGRSNMNKGKFEKEMEDCQHPESKQKIWGAKGVHGPTRGYVCTMCGTR